MPLDCLWLHERLDAYEIDQSAPPHQECAVTQTFWLAMQILVLFLSGDRNRQRRDQAVIGFYDIEHAE